MDERLVQALIRLLTIGGVAFVGAVGANLTILQDAVEDPIVASLVVSVTTAVLSAITKWLGGATVPAHLETRGRGADATPIERPNPFAI